MKLIWSWLRVFTLSGFLVFGFGSQLFAEASINIDFTRSQIFGSFDILSILSIIMMIILIIMSGLYFVKYDF